MKTNSAKKTNNKNVREYLLKNDVEIAPKKKKGRWAMTAGVCSGNYSKLFLLNMISIIFFLPTIIALVYRNGQISTLASSYPFTQNVFIGYPVYPVLKGTVEQISMYANRYLMLGFLAFAVIGSLAISGIFYLVRNLIWTDGNFRTKDFFKGIKKNYLMVLALSVLYALILCVATYLIGYSDYMRALGGNWFFILLKVASIIIVVILSMVYLYAVTFTINYKANFFLLIKNAFKLTFTFIIPNTFMLLFACLPFILYSLIKVSILNMLLMFLLMIMGFVFFSIVWNSYSMFVYEKVVKSKNLYTAKEVSELNKDKAKKVTEQSQTLDENYFEQMGNNYSMKGVKPITDEEMGLHELPTSFSREDLIRLEESKRRMQTDSDEYQKNFDESNNEKQ